MTSFDELGLTVRTLTPELAKKYEVTAVQGVIVIAVKPTSISAMAGIREGQVVLEVDRKPVHNVAEFKQAIRKSVVDKRVLLLLQNGATQQYLVLRW